MLSSIRMILPAMAASALALGAVMFSPIQQASACSILADYNPTTDATSIIVGRITGFDDPLSDDPMAPTLMHVDVQRTLSGEEQPDQLSLWTRVLKEDGAIMCMELDPRDYDGKDVVIALHEEENGSFMDSGDLTMWLVDSPAEGIGDDDLAAVYDANPKSEDGNTVAWTVVGVGGAAVALGAVIGGRRLAVKR